MPSTVVCPSVSLIKTEFLPPPSLAAIPYTYIVSLQERLHLPSQQKPLLNPIE